MVFVDTGSIANTAWDGGADKVLELVGTTTLKPRCSAGASRLWCA